MADDIIQGEKRWVASFMVDLVGSTELTEKLGAEKTFVLMQELMEQAVAIIESFGGYYVEYAGDSVFALFGAPVAIENATLNACRAAVALHENVASKQDDIRAKFGVVPQYRVGVAVGEVLVAALSMSDQKRINALGRAVNISARIQALAGPGEVFCGPSVVEEIEGYAKVEPVGEFELKGIEGTQEIFRLVELHEGRSSLEARMKRSASGYVGQIDQKDEITSWLLSDIPPTPVMTVIGAPGIGKSRIVSEVLDALPDAIHVNTAYCAPNDEHSSLKPIIALIRNAAKGDQAREIDEIKRWLPTFLGGHPPSEGLLSLLGSSQNSADVSGEGDIHNAVVLRREIVSVLRALSSQASRRLVIEDTHWLDGLSREILSEVLSDTAPLTRFLLTSRNKGDLKQGSLNFLEVEIRPLTQEDVNLLVTEAFPDLDATEDVKRQIFLKSEGNPLFAEEMLRHLERDKSSSSGLSLPSGREIGSIQNLVFSRFDALSDVEKVTLKAAAFLGRVVKRRQLEHITRDQKVVQAVLDVAVRAGLVEPAPDSVHWRFAHVLIQEAIANSVPSAEAAKLHAQAAETLLAVEADAKSKLAHDLAYHFDKADMPREALNFYVRASQAAWRVSALDLSLTHVERAEVLVSQIGEDVPDALFSDMLQHYLRVLDVTGNWARSREIGNKYLTRMEANEDQRGRTVVLTLLAKAANQCSEFERSMELIERGLTAADALGDDQVLGLVKTIQMDIVNDLPTNDQNEVLALFEETRAYAESGRDLQMTRMRLYEMAAYYRQVGDVKQAMALSAKLVQLGRDKNYTPALSMGLWVQGSIYAMIEEWPEALAVSQESMSHSIEGTMDYVTAYVFSLGATLMINQAGVTSAELVEISNRRAAAGDASIAIIAAFYSSGVHFAAGQIRDGIKQLDYTQSLVDKGAERGLVQQFYIKKIELMLTIAGKFPNPFGAPKVPLAEVPTALKLRLSAVKRARQAIAELEQRIVPIEGLHHGRLVLFKGVLAKGANRKALIAEAIEEFDKQGVAGMAKIARAL